MLSVVIPVYNEEKGIMEHIAVINKYLEKYDYEMIIVDDGSKDQTWQRILELHKENNRICRNSF